MIMGKYRKYCKMGLSTLICIVGSIMILTGCSKSKDDDFVGKHYLDALDSAKILKCSMQLKQLGTEILVMMSHESNIDFSGLPDGSELWNALGNLPGTTPLRAVLTKCPNSGIKYRGPLESGKIPWAGMDETAIIAMCPNCGNVLKCSTAVVTYQKESKEYKEAFELTSE
jgi:hypothetical protein